jgi:hypothetical protein
MDTEVITDMGVTDAARTGMEDTGTPCRCPFNLPRHHRPDIRSQARRLRLLSVASVLEQKGPTANIWPVGSTTIAI